MATSGLLRHQIIERLITPHTKKVAEAAFIQWEQLAAQIVTIVGEDGFNVLYARSVFLAQPTFPWLAAISPDHGFAALKMSYAKHPPEQAGAANSFLLITFTDILASLIGEQLTTSLVCLAWNIDDRNQPKSRHGVQK
jgi:hypothetical protein